MQSPLLQQVKSLVLLGYGAAGHWRWRISHLVNFRNLPDHIDRGKELAVGGTIDTTVNGRYYKSEDSCSLTDG